MKCYNCNSEIEESDNFCPYCGINLKDKKKDQKEEVKIDQPPLEKQIIEAEKETKDTFEEEIGRRRNKKEKKVSKDKNKKKKIEENEKEFNRELDVLQKEKKKLEIEIESLRNTLRELKKEQEELMKTLEEYESKKDEYKKKEIELDRREIELNEKEQQLNEKYLELLNFENELIEKKRKIEENELNMFLAKELKDNSKFLADHIISDLERKEDLSMMNKVEIEIMNLIEFAREFLNKGMVDAAIHVYKKIEQKYYESVTSLPNPIIQKLHLRIIELYDDIHLKLSEMKHGNQ